MVKDLREAIAEVMTKVHGSGLAAMDMWDFDKKAFKPISTYNLSFDSQQNQLEPIYYWFLDFIDQIGRKSVKTIDNFMASPGSGQFSEMSMKATRMQEEGMKILGGMNQVIKSILNLIYDLKEFELRLESYDAYHSTDKKIREAGVLALKQIWLDNVDMKKGRGAIHSMATAEMGFSTLREAFMIADGVEGAKKLNSEDKENGGAGLINDSVMRILIPRLYEFEKWVDYSEKELRKRFDIEKNYLKSQVETVKLYSQWMKPYFIAAEKLRQQGFEKDAALVNAFSTTMFELQLMSEKDVGYDDERFENYNLRRKYKSVFFITMKYRGHVSQRVTQKGDYGFGMGGLVDIEFNSYALNEEELDAAKKLLAEDDITSGMEFSMDIASDALNTMKEDLDYFLKTKEEKDAEDAKNKKEKVKEENLDINPFAVLWSGLVDLFSLSFKSKVKKGDKAERIEDIKKDNFVEKTMRGAAVSAAASSVHTVYDVYKKAHRMASAPNAGFDTHDTDVVDALEDGGSVGFRDIFKGRGD